MPHSKEHASSSRDQARAAAAEARAAKAERELRALKAANAAKEHHRKVQQEETHEKLKNPKLIASMNFNQDCCVVQ